MTNKGKRVKAHYRGTLDDGTQFDSSYDRGEPLEFICGSGQMIAGFDEAVLTMASHEFGGEGREHGDEASEGLVVEDASFAYGHGASRHVALSQRHPHEARLFTSLAARILLWLSGRRTGLGHTAHDARDGGARHRPAALRGRV